MKTLLLPKLGSTRPIDRQKRIRCQDQSVRRWLMVGVLAFCIPQCVSLNNVQAAWQEDESGDASRISFYEEIRPILQAKCHGCHQPAKDEGDYIMTNFDSFLEGGASGDLAVVPGDAEASYLIELIMPYEGSAEMPMDGEPLRDDEVELIRRWIDEGAENDTPMNATTAFDMDNPPVYNSSPVITSIDFSADGNWLAVSGYHEVLVYAVPGFELAARLVGTSERIESAVFSPDSKRLAVAGGSPGRMGEVQVWDIESSELLLSHTEGFDTLYGASWSGDGSLIAFGCPDTTVRAIDATTGEERLFNGAHDDWVLDTEFSVQSDHLVTVGRDRSMKLIKVDTQRFIDNITSITPGALKGGLNAVDGHPTEEQLLTGGADGVPKVYRMIREQARKIGDDFNLIRAYPAMTGRIYDVRFSADGSHIVACSSYNGSGQIRVYQTDDASQKVNIDVTEGGMFSADFSHDGSLIAAGGFDGVIRIYNIEDGQLVDAFSPMDIQDVATNE